MIDVGYIYIPYVDPMGYIYIYVCAHTYISLIEMLSLSLKPYSRDKPKL